MHRRGDDTALHAACTHIEDCNVPWGAYQTDGILDRFKPAPKTPGEAAKPSLLARLRSATKSSPSKDAAPADAKPPAQGLRTNFFGAKPKVQWDVHSTYSNLTTTYSAANHYEYGEEMTPK